MDLESISFATRTQCLRLQLNSNNLWNLMLNNGQLQSTHADMYISQQFRMRLELGAKAIKFLPGRMTQCFFPRPLSRSGRASSRSCLSSCRCAIAQWKGQTVQNTNCQVNCQLHFNASPGPFCPPSTSLPQEIDPCVVVCFPIRHWRS